MEAQVFRPERQANETQEQYHERRHVAKQILQRLTLSGPYAAAGRKAPNLRQQLRDAQKHSGSFIAGSFGKGLRNAITRKNKAALEAKQA